MRVLNDYKRFYQREQFNVFYTIFAEPKSRSMELDKRKLYVLGYILYVSIVLMCIWSMRKNQFWPALIGYSVSLPIAVYLVKEVIGYYKNKNHNYFSLRDVDYTKVAANQKVALYSLLKSFYEHVSQDKKLYVDKILGDYYLLTGLNHDDFEKYGGNSIDFYANTAETIKDTQVRDEFYMVCEELKKYCNTPEADKLYNRIKSAFKR